MLVLILAGCGTSTVVTKVRITERPDSLVIKGDSIGFQTVSDSVGVDSIETTSDKVDSTAAKDLTPIPSPARRGEYAFRSIHAKKDTTVGRWKLRFGYDYPPDRWKIEIIEADTMARWIVRDSLIEKPYEVEVVPFWVKLVIGVLGAALILSLAKR
jgi:hypothetical protein